MTTTRLLGLFLALLLAAGLAACGEDVVEVFDNDETVNDGNGQTDNQNNDEANGPSGPEDCEDGEIFNPSLEECVPAGGNGGNEPEENDAEENQNNDDPSQECEEDEVWDEEEGECVPDLPAECGPGHLIGSACRPDGANLGGAHVKIEGVDCEGDYFSMETVADGEGDYSFNDIPSGTHELTITSGSFEGVEEVDIYKGLTQDLTSDSAKICLQGESVNVAVIQGSFDNIRELLTGMGIPHNVYSTNNENAQLLGDLSNLLYYDIVFAECGSTWSSLASNPFNYDIGDMEQNIRTFIEMGNSFYASDWASQYAEIPFGDAFTFHSSRAPAQTIPADVLTDDMQTLLGSTTTEVIFNASGVHVVEEVGPATEVQFEGLTELNGGATQVLPLMSIYYDFVGGGRVVYTSFHNSAQATGDMHDILEFMIFQL